MSTLEEICKTFGDAAYPLHTWDGIPAAAKFMYRDGLTAVLERHVRGMIVSAARYGFRLNEGQELSDAVQAIDNYADRIITQLKGQKE